MDNKIHNIILEEINKFIIRENISSLMTYSNELENYLRKLATVQVQDKNIAKYISNFTNYTLQVIFAIKRCVQNNNLNEDFRLGDYGINLPPELGGNLWYDMKRGYYNTKNFLTRGRYGNNYYSNVSGKLNNPNSVKSEKLSVLLSYLRQKVQEYNSMQTKYNITQYTSLNGRCIIYQILGVMTQLQRDYQQLVNTQRQTQQTQGQQTP